MTGVGDSINAGVGLFVSDGLGKGLDGYVDVVTLELDNCFSFSMMKILRIL